MVYSKPELYVERFLPNQNVAQTCEPSSEVNPVHVSCLIKSGDVDGVFYGSPSCSYIADNTNLVTIDWDDVKSEIGNNDLSGATISPADDGDYASNQYLYWTGSTSGKPAAGGVQSDGVIYGGLLMTVLGKLGITGAGLHAGLATPEVLSVINHS